MSGKKTSIYLTDSLKTKLRLDVDRGIGQAIHEMVDRYDVLIGSEEERVKNIFTTDEWTAMYSVCNGTRWNPAAIRGGVLANLEDSLDEEIKLFRADRAEMEGKLKKLSVLQQFTLVELIEEFWRKHSEQ